MFKYILILFSLNLITLTSVQTIENIFLGGVNLSLRTYTV